MNPATRLILSLGFIVATQAQLVAATIVKSVAGYYTASDGYQHAIVGMGDGRIQEIFLNPQKGNFLDTLGCFEQAISVSGFWADADKFQHVIFVTQTGDVQEIWFDSAHGTHSALLRNIPGAFAVAGFYSSDDQIEHAIVAAQSGDLHELYWRPAQGVSDASLGHFANIISIGAFYSPDDNFRIVHIATSDGNLRELFYHPTKGQGQSVIATLSGIVSVGSFYTADDHYRHAIVATNNGNVTEVFYNPNSGKGQAVLSNFGQIASISGYFTQNDSYRHVIVGDQQGNVHELFYSPKTGQGRSILRTFSSTPAAEDISPDTANGTVNNPPSGGTTAGVIVGMTGDESALYAVSQNAGIWKSTGGGAWTQLQSSPPFAFSVAIDPQNANHLVVGERDGVAQPFNLNRSGVWESKDGGNNWAYIFNPLSQSGCRAAQSQAIASVAISARSTIFIATPCGVGRRRTTDTSFSFPAQVQSLGAATAVVATNSKIWARSASALMYSADDGATWTAAPPIPNSVTFGGRNTDIYALGAFDFAAYMVAVGAATEDGQNHYMDLVIFSVQSQSWSEQRINFNNVGVRDGTGLGGRRFIRTFELPRPDLPSNVGSRLELYVSNAQEIYRATGLNNDGTITAWERPVGASGPGLSNQDPVHSDIWFFHLPPQGHTAWVANDGGVFQASLAGANGFQPQGWILHNHGLHTHHAHTLTVARSDRCGPQNVAYATSDNDAWVRGAQSNWSNPQVFGDANWSAGDAANSSIALLSRNHEEPWLTGFGANLPTGSPWLQFALNTDTSLDTASVLRYPAQFIQTLASESADPLLDVALLQRLPLGNPNDSGGAVLLRNNKFATTLNVNSVLYANWSTELNNLPAGINGFWVVGGHAKPDYFASTLVSGATTLYKRTGTLPPPNQTVWIPLSVGANILAGSPHGPAFINPYDPTQLFVLTDKGIEASRDGGFSFRIDDILTKLVTASGTYPLIGNFAGTNTTNTPLANHENAMGTLTDLAVNRFNPSELVIASPYTGVFYTNGDGTWRTLTQSLPTPRTPISSLGIDCQGVYVAMEGRSVMQIVNYRNAPLASWFAPATSFEKNGVFFTLNNSATSTVAHSSVSVIVTDANGADVFVGSVQTDLKGEGVLPAQIQSGSYEVHLRFAGNNSTGPSDCAFVMSL